MDNAAVGNLFKTSRRADLARSWGNTTAKADDGDSSNTFNGSTIRAGRHSALRLEKPCRLVRTEGWLKRALWGGHDKRDRSSLIPASRSRRGFIESFNGSLRDELLNEERFTARRCPQEAGVWRYDYNHVRPTTQSLGNQTPAEKRGGRFEGGNLRAQRTTRLPKLTNEEYEIQTADSDYDEGARARRIKCVRIKTKKKPVGF